MLSPQLAPDRTSASGAGRSACRATRTQSAGVPPCAHALSPRRSTAIRRRSVIEWPLPLRSTSGATTFTSASGSSAATRASAPRQGASKPSSLVTRTIRRRPVPDWSTVRRDAPRGGGGRSSRAATGTLRPRVALSTTVSRVGIHAEAYQGASDLSAVEQATDLMPGRGCVLAVDGPGSPTAKRTGAASTAI